MPAKLPSQSEQYLSPSPVRAVEAEVDRVLAEWLAAHAGALPTEPDLLALVRAAFPLHAQRRLARSYARGFVRGYTLAEERERQQRATDLALIEARAAELLALVRALQPP